MPTISQQLFQTFKKPNVAETYGPFASLAAAHAALAGDQLNIIGMTVGIQVDANHIEEYWYQGGTTQAHLVKKQKVEDIPASALAGDIPASKLSSGVQTSLGKADTAYQKPGTGIPESDLASAVQTSLGKADTAVQPADIAALDGNPTGTSADGHVSVQVTEVDGVVNGVNVTTNDIASASALAGEVSRAQGAESALDAEKADKATTLYGYGITNAYTKSEVDGMVSTPHQNYVTVADYASLPATGSDDTIYRVSCWDGAYNSGAGQVDNTKYTEYAWNGTAYVLLRVMDATAEVFDISAYNNATYDDLTDALGVSGANVPADLRAGGMSVKFIKTATDQYEQWRLMSATWSIAVSDWQGVDDEPTAGSDNLVKSGGVKECFENVLYGNIIGEEELTLSEDNRYFNTSDVSVGGTYVGVSAPASTSTIKCVKVNVLEGDFFRIKGKGLTNATGLYVLTNAENIVVAVEKVANYRETPKELTIENDGYLYVNLNDYVDSDAVYKRIRDRSNSLNGLDERVTELEESQVGVVERMDGLENVVGEKISKIIINTIQEDISNDSIITNSYIKGYGNGDIGTLNNFKVYRFPVVGGETYKITGLKATSDSVGFAIFHTSGGDDNTYKIADSYLSSYGDDNPAENRLVTAPSTAAYLYIQRGNTTDAVTPRCVHITYETIPAEERIVAIGDTSELEETIVEELKKQHNATQDINSNLMLNALSAGVKLINYSKKHPFAWSFPKMIVSIKVDDLHPSVDLAVKAAQDIGINVILGAPASQLDTEVTGITTPADRIGDTALEVCQYLVEHGGEIVEHSTGTFSDESQINEYFIKQKEIFLNNGIILRGAAVANSSPSDSLKDKLEPYLRFYYDYSNGYGKEIPYNTSGNLVRSHTYGTTGFTTPEEVLAAVDTWKNWSWNSWHTITFHAVAGSESGGYYITEADYRTILQGIKDRADNGDFYIMLWSETYDTYGGYE